MKLEKKLVIIIFTILVASVIIICIITGSKKAKASETNLNNVSNSFSTTKNTQKITRINDLESLIYNNIEAYFNTDVVSALPTELKDDDEISVIIELDEDAMYDIYSSSNTRRSFNEYLSTSNAQKSLNYLNYVLNQNIKSLEGENISYKLGERYNTLLTGFEVEIKKKDFNKLEELFPNATLILGDTYERCETEVVENYVNVYETGIFDSSDIEYQGDGVVVAVVDIVVVDVVVEFLD